MTEALRAFTALLDDAAVFPPGNLPLAAARASFTSFGTCSVTGPRDDLIRLGLLPAPAAA